MQLTIGKRITLGFALAVTVTAGLGAFMYSRLQSIGSSTAALAGDSLPGLVCMAKAQSLVRFNAVILVRRIALNDKAGIAELDEGLRKATEEITRQLSDY